MRRYIRSLGFRGLLTFVQNLLIFSPFRCHRAWDLVYALRYFFFSKCSISLSIAAAFVRVGGDVSRFSSCQVCVKSRFSALIRSDILGICFLAAFVASFFMSSLKLCHKVCALVDLSFALTFFRSEHSCCPLLFIALFSCLSCRRPRGQVHLSFPINGAVAGASRADTILWSEGMLDTSCDHPLMVSSISSFA